MKVRYFHDEEIAESESKYSMAIPELTVWPTIIPGEKMTWTLIVCLYFSDALSSSLSLLYAKIIVIIGIALPVTEVLTSRIPTIVYQSFYVYLYVISILFVVFVYTAHMRTRAVFSLIKTYRKWNTISLEPVVLSSVTSGCRWNTALLRMKWLRMKPKTTQWPYNRRKVSNATHKWKWNVCFGYLQMKKRIRTTRWNGEQCISVAFIYVSALYRSVLEPWFIRASNLVNISSWIVSEHFFAVITCSSSFFAVAARKKTDFLHSLFSDYRFFFHSFVDY